MNPKTTGKGFRNGANLAQGSLQVVRRDARRPWHRPHHRRERVRGAGGAVGLREDDDAPHDCGPGAHHRGRDLHRGPPHQRRAAARSGHRHGVPELRALSAHDGVREHVVRPSPAEAAERRDRPSGQGGGRDPRHRRAPRAPPQAAFRRSAAAGRDGAGHRAQSRGVPVRRAAVEPRRQAPGPDADGNQAHPPAGANDRGLRDARPGRGDDPGGPDRGDERRPRRAGCTAAGDVRQPGHPLRGRLHRLAGDELPPRPAHRERVGAIGDPLRRDPPQRPG